LNAISPRMMGGLLAALDHVDSASRRLSLRHSHRNGDAGFVLEQI
jgi:hypothetical protein